MGEEAGRSKTGPSGAEGKEIDGPRGKKRRIGPVVIGVFGLDWLWFWAGLSRAVWAGERPTETEKESRDLKHMLEDYRTLLYPDCKQGQKKLGTTLELLQWKASNGLSDKGFEELLKLLKNLLPESNTLLETTYEAKKVVCPLGLEA